VHLRIRGVGLEDWPRIASRVGPGQARIAEMLLLTLRGTPTIYYGDEIAMTQVEIGPEHVVDPLEVVDHRAARWLESQQSETQTFARRNGRRANA
jgi:glycosidase